MNPTALQASKEVDGGDDNVEVRGMKKKMIKPGGIKGMENRILRLSFLCINFIVYVNFSCLVKGK